jgi:hypothetical protein
VAQMGDIVNALRSLGRILEGTRFLEKTKRKTGYRNHKWMNLTQDCVNTYIHKYIHIYITNE